MAIFYATKLKKMDRKPRLTDLVTAGGITYLALNSVTAFRERR